QKVVELHLLDAQGRRTFSREEWVVGDDAHLEAHGARRDIGSDIAAADHAERLAGDLNAHEAVLFPFARLGRGVGGGKLARQRKHQGDRVLGGRDRVAERRVHDDDAARRRGWNVDIVDADAGAANDLEPRGRVEDLGSDLGRRADRQAVVAADGRRELFWVLAERGLEIDIDAAHREDLRGGGGKLIGNENPWAHAKILAR